MEYRVIEVNELSTPHGALGTYQYFKLVIEDLEKLSTPHGALGIGCL